MKSQILSLIQAFVDFKYTPGLVLVKEHEHEKKTIVTADGFPIIEYVPFSNEMTIGIFKMFGESNGKVNFTTVDELKKKLLKELKKK